MVDDEAFELLLVTGMSGAGRSTAARALEDLGWFVVDNLPPALLPQAVDEVKSDQELERLAVVVDARGGTMFDDLDESLAGIRAQGVDLRVLFLEAGDNELVRRFESSRRPHPLQGSGGILDGLVRERALLGDMRSRADLVIDTSSLNVHDLRRKIDAAFGGDERVALRATVMSFGFKYGIPVDADIVCDVRFLPNPYWVPELRDLTGLDPAVSDALVLRRPEAGGGRSQTGNVSPALPERRSAAHRPGSTRRRTRKSGPSNTSKSVPARTSRPSPAQPATRPRLAGRAGEFKGGTAFTTRNHLAAACVALEKWRGVQQVVTLHLVHLDEGVACAFRIQILGRSDLPLALDARDARIAEPCSERGRDLFASRLAARTRIPAAQQDHAIVPGRARRGRIHRLERRRQIPDAVLG